MPGEILSPVELKERVIELHALIIGRGSHYSRKTKLGRRQQAEELAQALDELVVQGEALSDVLRDLA